MAAKAAPAAQNNRGFPKSSTYQWIDAVNSEERAKSKWNEMYADEHPQAATTTDKSKDADLAKTSFPARTSDMYGWHVDGSAKLKDSATITKEASQTASISVTSRDFALPFVLESQMQQTRSKSMIDTTEMPQSPASAALSSTTSPTQTAPAKIMQMDRQINYRKPTNVFNPNNLW
jgi:hypothetical protein